MGRRRPLCHRPAAPLVAISPTNQMAAASAVKFTELSGSKKRLPSKSSKITRSTINRFHTLIKAQHAAKTEEDRRQIQAEIDAIGGLCVYQQASLLGQSVQRGGDTSRWLLPHLRRIKSGDLGSKTDSEANQIIFPVKYESQNRIRLLDVGALKMNYDQYRQWIDCTAIDLNSQQSDRILRQDFMDMPVPVADAEKFNIVCLSLVLNFVPSPELRGRMLQRIRSFLRQECHNYGAWLFIVLPLACIKNSRYMTDEHFCRILKSIGFSLVQSHFSTKLVYYLFRMDTTFSSTIPSVLSKKSVLVEGANRNNFSIILPFA